MYRESRRDGRTLGLRIVKHCRGCRIPISPGGTYLFTVDRYPTRKMCYRCSSDMAWFRHPYQRNAMLAVRAAIARGDLPPASRFFCTDCSKPATCYDHRDYSKPLAVDPVCSGCNSRRGPAVISGVTPPSLSRPAIDFSKIHELNVTTFGSERNSVHSRTRRSQAMPTVASAGLTA
jgi:hypothetical protein